MQNLFFFWTDLIKPIVRSGSLAPEVGLYSEAIGIIRVIRVQVFSELQGAQSAIEARHDSSRSRPPVA